MLCPLNLCIGAFTVQPTSVVQAEGVTAQFTCQNQDAIKLTWSIGGVFLSHHHPPNVTVERNMLLISIQCKAILTAVHNLSINKLQSNAFSLPWLPPFSLNLTNAEPDTVYCIEIYNVTNEMNREHLRCAQH